MRAPQKKCVRYRQSRDEGLIIIAQCNLKQITCTSNYKPSESQTDREPTTTKQELREAGSRATPGQLRIKMLIHERSSSITHSCPSPGSAETSRLDCESFVCTAGDRKQIYRHGDESADGRTDGRTMTISFPRWKSYLHTRS